MAIRILLVDDHPIVRQGLKTLLEGHSGWEVIGEASDGAEAVEKAKDLSPDVMVLDVTMPRMNGLEAATILHDMLPKVPIILYTLHKDIVPEKRAQAVGVRAVVSKSDQIDVLLEEVLNFVGVVRVASA